jgi:uncharacterized protein with GYD domain
MARYIALLTFTEQGAKALKKSTNRARQFDKLAAKSGVKVEAQFWTVGRYDGVLLLSADESQKILHLLAALAALGNVRTESLQAFTDSEFDGILSA